MTDHLLEGVRWTRRNRGLPIRDRCARLQNVSKTPVESRGLTKTPEPKAKPLSPPLQFQQSVGHPFMNPVLNEILETERVVKCDGSTIPLDYSVSPEDGAMLQQLVRDLKPRVTSTTPLLLLAGGFSTGY
jgi:hypothetical protein